MDHYRMGLRRLHAIDYCFKHRSSRANHSLGRIHNPFDGVFDIRRRERGAVVPFDALVEVEGNGSAIFAEFPRVREFGNDFRG
ncbi:MAG: hypothetical protein ETSY2_09705 [Candidatus Entotheonella gemina]|uniref:Uncharacterized protein n=1 Tax=Candidatus Entotheonella gemina TaxID=1429439 RepID=W4MCQ6_9BACT|nr:MAG: hypothetical protein ETSY2_09705 [Candidatus Entotheonella gemina]